MLLQLLQLCFADVVLCWLVICRRYVITEVFSKNNIRVGIAAVVASWPVKTLLSNDPKHIGEHITIKRNHTIITNVKIVPHTTDQVHWGTFKAKDPSDPSIIARNINEIISYTRVSIMTYGAITVLYDDFNLT